MISLHKNKENRYLTNFLADKRSMDQTRIRFLAILRKVIGQQILNNKDNNDDLE